MYAFAAVEPVARTYNLVLEAASAREDLEALVLVHPHTEIVDPGSETRCARRWSIPMSARRVRRRHGVRSIAWWEGEVRGTWCSVRGVRRRRGPGLSWTERRLPPAEVEALDGQLLVLSPWVVRNVRFDESLLVRPRLRARFQPAGPKGRRKLMVADLRVVHHRSLELIGELDVWVEAHIRLAEKWDGTVHAGPRREAGWKRRARRAEAGARRHERSRCRSRSSSTPAYSSSSASSSSTTHAVLADDGPAARDQPAARGGRAGQRADPSSSGWRISSLETTDWLGRDAGACAQPREPLGDRERARVEQPLEHRLLAREPVLRVPDLVWRS